MAATTSTRARRFSRTSATGVGIAGISVAVLQFMESRATDFNPSRKVSILIAIAGLFAGMVFERVVLLLGRRNTLDTHLRTWPLERLGDVDPLSLGVFPATPASGLQKYVPRSIDGDVEEALSGEPLQRRNVVIFGPTGAGKSRTAYQAAKAAQEDAVVVVPATADGLGELLEDDAWQALPPDAILWLDDLERYLDVLAASSANVLFDPESPWTVVATIREDKYREMIEAGGDLGESARRLLRSARVRRLGPRDALSTRDAWLQGSEALAPVERPETRERLGSWLGRAVRTARDGLLLALAAPAVYVGHRLARGPAGTGRDDGVLALALAALEITLVILGNTLVHDGFSKATAPSLADQVDAVAQGAHAQVVADRTVAFRPGDKTTVFVLRRPARSDQLRVYDEGDEQLKRRTANFAFGPKVPGRRLLLQRPSASDIDENDRRELLLTYAVTVGARRLRIPALVALDEEHHYVMSPVVTERPRFERARAGAVLRTDAFTTPFELGKPKALGWRPGPLPRTYGVTSAIVVPSLSLAVTASEIGADPPRDAVIAVALYKLEIGPDGVLSAKRLCSPKHPSGFVSMRTPAAPGADYQTYLQRVYPPLSQQLRGVREGGSCAPG